MYVCLCNGVTRHEVLEAIAHGAKTTKQVVTATDAGSDRGRCRRNSQALLGRVA